MTSVDLADLVVYHSPHLLRGKNPHVHFERIDHFLRNCTREFSLTKLALQVRSGPAYDEVKSQSLIEKFTQRWGPAEKRLEVLGSRGRQESHAWTPNLTFDELLALVLSDRGLRQAPLPMLAVSFHGSFKLLDPGTGGELPRQNWGHENYMKDEFFLPHGFSEIWGDLGETSALGALISFPFAANDPVFHEYLAFFQSHFPTRLSTRSSNWHWWIVRKDRTRHFRRSAVPAVGGAEALKTLFSRTSVNR